MSEHLCGGVQIDTFEVGLGFHEELGEVFGRFAADRVREGSHVRSVQRLCVTCEVTLLGVTKVCVHLRDPVRRRVGHGLARKEWSLRVHSIGLLLIGNLCPHAAPHVYSERDLDEGALGEDAG